MTGPELPSIPARYSKAIAGAIGIVLTIGGEILNAGLLHGQAQHVVSVAVSVIGGVATLLGIVVAPKNADIPPAGTLGPPVPEPTFAGDMPPAPPAYEGSPAHSLDIAELQQRLADLEERIRPTAPPPPETVEAPPPELHADGLLGPAAQAARR